MIPRPPRHGWVTEPAFPDFDTFRSTGVHPTTPSTYRGPELIARNTLLDGAPGYGSLLDDLGVTS